MELFSSAIPLMNGRRIGSGSSGHTGKKGEHKIRKQKLDKLECSIAELPACFEDLLKSLNGYCHSGVKLANLFDTVFEDTPLLMVAMRYREACEQLNEKCKRLEILFQPELASACKKTSPCVGHLRSCLDAHSKALSRYESAQNSLESISNAENASRQKTKFQNSLKEFAQEDTNLARFSDELDRLRVEVCDFSCCVATCTCLLRVRVCVSLCARVCISMLAKCSVIGLLLGHGCGTWVAIFVLMATDLVGTVPLCLKSVLVVFMPACPQNMFSVFKKVHMYRV